MTRVHLRAGAPALLSLGVAPAALPGEPLKVCGFVFFLIFKCTFWLYVRIHSKTDLKNVYVEFRIESLLHYDLFN